MDYRSALSTDAPSASTPPLDTETILAPTPWLILTLLMKKLGAAPGNHSMGPRKLLNLVSRELKWG